MTLHYTIVKCEGLVNLTLRDGWHDEAIHDFAEDWLALHAEVERLRDSGLHAETVVAPDGSPVAAPCAIQGCQYERVAQAEAEVAALQQAVSNHASSLNYEKRRREQAEAEVARLRASLAEMIVLHANHCAMSCDTTVERTARALVDGPRQQALTEPIP